MRAESGDGLLPDGWIAARRRGQAVYCVRPVLSRCIRRIVFNHIWLVAAAPVFPHTRVADRQDRFAGAARQGRRRRRTARRQHDHSVNSPHAPWSKTGERMPSQTMPTIGDRLDDQGVRGGVVRRRLERRRRGQRPDPTSSNTTTNPSSTSHASPTARLARAAPPEGRSRPPRRCREAAPCRQQRAAQDQNATLK